jgi:hypothetical protein
VKTSAVIYKCKCLQDEVTFQVRARGPHQDIANWMRNQVEPGLSRDHRERSPLCMATAVEYLKLPVPEDNRRIGDSPEDAN